MVMILIAWVGRTIRLYDQKRKKKGAEASNYTFWEGPSESYAAGATEPKISKNLVGSQQQQQIKKKKETNNYFGEN